MTGPLPAEAAARTDVHLALADLSDGALVLVACSGGADSLALAAATAFVAPRSGLRAGAVIVDHGMQAGSAAVAAVAAEQCRELGLDPVEVRTVSVGRTGGPEGAARSARYEALEGAARDHGADAVLLGHTLDDQAETVLLGLARGSGARSLAGMAAIRGLWRRPLLGLRRLDTEAICTARDLEPWDDPTNFLTADAPHNAPRRTRVRHDVLPVMTAALGPGVVPSLARTADLLRDDADLLDALATDLLKTAMDAAMPAVEGDEDADTQPDRVALDTATLARGPRALRRRALRAAAVQAGSARGSLGLSHVDALDALIVDWHGQKAINLPGGVAALRRCGTLVLGPPRV